MEYLNRSLCAICGEFRQAGETWFLISENRWEDRLRIFRWDRRMAANRGMRAVCGQRHARELVVHWMTTGCLDYPFAAASPISPAHGIALDVCRSADILCGRRELGELAVDRAAMRRALIENPLSLNAVLDELAVALENELLENPESESDRIALAPRTV